MSTENEGLRTLVSVGAETFGDLRGIQEKIIVQAKRILMNRREYQWSLQGFGVLRTYISEDVHLHVWDARFRVSNVSDIHTHPWDFTSFVIAGRLSNRLYVEGPPSPVCLPHMTKEILCGPIEDEKVRVAQFRDPGKMIHLGHVSLSSGTSDGIYEAGTCYSQKAEEIHRTSCIAGTVTVVHRTFREDREHAKVFWPVGQGWISAEPRRATEREVDEICEHSLKHWFR